MFPPNPHVIAVCRVALPDVSVQCQLAVLPANVKEYSFTE